LEFIFIINFTFYGLSILVYARVWAIFQGRKLYNSSKSSRHAEPCSYKSSKWANHQNQLDTLCDDYPFSFILFLPGISRLDHLFSALAHA
jgi:hypothetical protein